jgi:hypothetical protein
MSDLLFDDPPPTYPDSVIVSIYNAYPRKCNRKEALRRIREALDRICAGEIDGMPRSPAQAIEFLRERTGAARKEFSVREKHFIPHMTTWLHGSRYLRSAPPIEMPKGLQTCIKILALYPKMPGEVDIAVNPEAFLPALIAIDKALDRLDKSKESPLGYLVRRVMTYAMHVSQWPESDLQYVPSPQKWFGECRYEHAESTWQRQSANGFGQERDQLKRLLQ